MSKARLEALRDLQRRLVRRLAKVERKIRVLEGDVLGYDTNRPIREVAAEMARAALAGENKDAVAAEMAAVKRRLGRSDV